MKSWWMVAGATGPELELRDTPLPTPGPGQLLVQVQAAGLNRGEFITGQGLLGQLAQAKAMGMEAAGSVIALGSGVSGFQLGQRVMGRAIGGFAEQALLVATEAMPMPDHFDWVHGASLPITYMVSHDMLVAQGELAAGEWLLLNGAASGVGTASLQLAQLIGAHTIGTSGQAHKLDALRQIGLEAGVLTRGGGFATKSCGAPVARASTWRSTRSAAASWPNKSSPWPTGADWASLATSTANSRHP